MSDTLVLKRHDAAHICGLSLRQLERLAGDGPARIQLSQGRVGYRRADLEAWVASRQAA